MAKLSKVKRKHHLLFKIWMQEICSLYLTACLPENSWPQVLSKEQSWRSRLPVSVVLLLMLVLISIASCRNSPKCLCSRIRKANRMGSILKLSKAPGFFRAMQPSSPVMSHLRHISHLAASNKEKIASSKINCSRILILASLIKWNQNRNWACQRSVLPWQRCAKNQTWSHFRTRLLRMTMLVPFRCQATLSDKTLWKNRRWRRHCKRLWTRLSCQYKPKPEMNCSTFSVKSSNSASPRSPSRRTIAMLRGPRP